MIYARGSVSNISAVHRARSTAAAHWGRGQGRVGRAAKESKTFFLVCVYPLSKLVQPVEVRAQNSSLIVV